MKAGPNKHISKLVCINCQMNPFKCNPLSFVYVISLFRCICVKWRFTHIKKGRDVTNYKDLLSAQCRVDQGGTVKKSLKRQREELYPVEIVERAEHKFTCEGSLYWIRRCIWRMEGQRWLRRARSRSFELIPSRDEIQDASWSVWAFFTVQRAEFSQ